MVRVHQLPTTVPLIILEMPLIEFYQKPKFLMRLIVSRHCSWCPRWKPDQNHEFL